MNQTTSLRLKAFAAVVISVMARAPLRAQSSNFAADLGLAGQGDSWMHEGVGVSPIGVLGGLRWSSSGAHARIGINSQLSLFPVVSAERNVVVYTPNGEYREHFIHRPLFLNVTTMRAELGAREGDGGSAWFVGGGVASVLSTPRDGDGVVPVGESGARFALTRRFGWALR